MDVVRVGAAMDLEEGEVVGDPLESTLVVGEVGVEGEAVGVEAAVEEGVMVYQCVRMIISAGTFMVDLWVTTWDSLDVLVVRLYHGYSRKVFVLLAAWLSAPSRNIYLH